MSRTPGEQCGQKSIARYSRKETGFEPAEPVGLCKHWFTLEDELEFLPSSEQRADVLDLLCLNISS